MEKNTPLICNLSDTRHLHYMPHSQYFKLSCHLEKLRFAMYVKKKELEGAALRVAYTKLPRLFAPSALSLGQRGDVDTRAGLRIRAHYVRLSQASGMSRIL